MIFLEIFTFFALRCKLFILNVTQWGGLLPPTNLVLLSEKSVKSAAEKMLTKYGSQASGMADVRARSLAAEGLPSFAATWERIRDLIGDVQSRMREMK